MSRDATFEDLLCLGREYLELHSFIDEKGCKSSCEHWEVGRTECPDYRGESYYYFRFGGYCLGDCRRWHEVTGKTPQEVLNQTRQLFSEIRTEEENWQKARNQPQPKCNPHAETSPRDIEALQKALEAGSYNNAPGSLNKGEALKVEPLPSWTFNGMPTKIIEVATGQKHEVVSSCYSKFDKGTIVTIEKNGDYVDLDPDQYEVIERHYSPIPGRDE